MTSPLGVDAIAVGDADIVVEGIADGLGGALAEREGREGGGVARVPGPVVSLTDFSNRLFDHSVASTVVNL
jgi:hypothetical protein